MPFIDKKIIADSETVGSQLKTKREQLGLGLDEAAKTINISKKYLLALENDALEKLPAGVYGQIFLTKYANFLKINAKQLQQDALKKSGLDKKTNKKYAFSPKKQVKKFDLVLLPRIVKNILIALAIIIFFLYLGTYLTSSLSPPPIEIISPADNLITTDNIIEVVGKTNSNVNISINDKSVLINENGSFKQLVNLKKGVNIITIVAKKKYGQAKIITKQILVE